METQNQHQLEIEATRVGGFGGSDAKLLYKIGHAGLAALTNTDLKRISVMMGLSTYQPIPMTAAMQQGHDFEDEVAKTMGPSTIKEYYLEANFTPAFKTFAHADFARESSQGLVVTECKCTKDDIEATAAKYAEQLQWYYMLGAHRVVLCHATNPTGMQEEIDIPRDTDMITVLMAGIEALSGAIAAGWTPDVRDNWTAIDLTDDDAALVSVTADVLGRIKELEDKAAEYRERLKAMMELYGVQSIKTDALTVSYVPETTARTFDSKKAIAAFPDLNSDEFYKTAKRSSSIRFTLNK